MGEAVIFAEERIERIEDARPVPQLGPDAQLLTDLLGADRSDRMQQRYGYAHHVEGIDESLLALLVGTIVRIGALFGPELVDVANIRAHLLDARVKLMP